MIFVSGVLTINGVISKRNNQGSQFLLETSGATSLHQNILDPLLSLGYSIIFVRVNCT